MAFAGEYEGYSGLWGKIKEQFSRWETSARKELERTEQKVRPITKALLPVAGAVAGTILLPGLGTVVAGGIGGAAVSAGQAVYETEEAKKEAKAAMGQMALPTAPTDVAEPVIAPPAVRAGFFSKPSNLLLAGLTIGLIAYVPPLKRRRRRRRR